MSHHLPDDPAGQAEMVLTGEIRYDDVHRESQAIVRAAWDARSAELLAAVDFSDEYGPGELVAEADELGNLVMTAPRRRTTKG